MAQSVQPGQPFKVVAVNVNGLAAADKRRNFFAWLQQQDYAIMLLSETHSTSDTQGQQWVTKGAGSGRPWQGLAFFALQQQQGELAAGGTAVLLSHRIVGTAGEPTVEHTRSPPAGCFKCHGSPLGASAIGSSSSVCSVHAARQV